MIRAVGRASATVLSCLLGACAGMSPSAAVPKLDGTAWVLVSLADRAVLPDAKPTAQFTAGRVQGTDGCNRYFSTYTQTEAAIQVGERGGMSMMACPPAVMQQAEAFMESLTSARSVRLVEGQLELLGAADVVLATFAEQSRSLAGTSWSVTVFNNGRQAAVSPLAGTDLSLAFSGDGRVSGSAGCNTFNGSFTSDGVMLSIGSLATTRRMCAAPAGVMEQEQQFLQALQSAATANFESDRLDLRTADDAIAVMLVRTP